jgi:hypothetical protein
MGLKPFDLMEIYSNNKWKLNCKQLNNSFSQSSNLQLQQIQEIEPFYIIFDEPELPLA